MERFLAVSSVAFGETAAKKKPPGLPAVWSGLRPV